MDDNLVHMYVHFLLAEIGIAVYVLRAHISMICPPSLFSAWSTSIDVLEMGTPPTWLPIHLHIVPILLLISLFFKPSGRVYQCPSHGQKGRSIAWAKIKKNKIKNQNVAHHQIKFV